MKRFFSSLGIIFLVAFLQLLPSAAAQSNLPIFPGASGFGTRSVAGSGRHLSPPKTLVYTVTSLADSGVGSLRDCVKQATPRTCIFAIAGRIQLATELLIDKPYVSIVGQTAPAPGILITGAGIRVATHDVLIQHLQILPGDAKTGPKPENRDGLTVAGKSGSAAYNVVLDHLSIAWSIDENFSAWYSSTSDVTLSNSIIAEALYRSIHPKGPHSMGVLVGDGVKRVSIHHSVLAHNYDRNPRMKAGSQLEFVANVVYGWGGSSSWNQANLSDSDNTKIATALIFAGNYYRPGPSSPRGKTVYAKPAASGSRIFVLSNIGPSRSSELSKEWDISAIAESPFRSLTPPFAGNVIPTFTATENYPLVLSKAGSRPRQSNSVDRRIVSEVTLGTGSIRDCVSGCTRATGGYPSAPTTVRTLAVPSNPHGDDNGNGYTNLEDWIQTFSRQVE